MLQEFGFANAFKRVVLYSLQQLANRFNIVVLPLFFQYSKSAKASEVNFMASIYRPDEALLPHPFALVR